MPDDARDVRTGPITTNHIRHERSSTRLDHRDRADHRDRDGRRRVPGRACAPAARRSSGSTGSTRRRSGARSPPRSTTSTRSPGCRPKTARQLDRFSQFGLVAGQLALEDAGLRPGRGRCRGPRADRDLPRQRARRDRLRRGPARALPRARDQGRRPEPRARGLRRGGAGQPRDRARRPRADPLDRELVRLRGRRARRGAERDPRRRDRRRDRGRRGGAAERRSRSGRSTSSGRCRTATTTTRPRPAGRSTPAATGSSWARASRLLVLEAEEVARARGAEPYAELLGYGATSDAYHMVQPRADGPGGGPRGDDRPRGRGRRRRTRSTG